MTHPTPKETMSREKKEKLFWEIMTDFQELFIDPDDLEYNAETKKWLKVSLNKAYEAGKAERKIKPKKSVKEKVISGGTEELRLYTWDEVKKIVNKEISKILPKAKVHLFKKI